MPGYSNVVGHSLPWGTQVFSGVRMAPTATDFARVLPGSRTVNGDYYVPGPVALAGQSDGKAEVTGPQPTRTFLAMFETPVSDFGTGPYTTGSITPPANSTVTVVVAYETNNTNTVPNITLADSATHAWNQRLFQAGNLAFSAWGQSIAIFTAPHTTGTFTLQVQAAVTTDIFTWRVCAFAYIGTDAAQLTGTTGGDTAVGGGGAYLLGLANTPVPTSEMLGVAVVDEDGTNANVTEGMTLIAESGVSPVLNVQGGTRTVPSVPWNQVAPLGFMYNAVALEIRSAAALTVTTGGPVKALAGGSDGTSATTGDLAIARAVAASTGVGASATSGALVTAVALASSTGVGTSAVTATGLGSARPLASTDAAGTSNATATTLTNLKALASTAGALGNSATSGALNTNPGLASASALGTSATQGTLIDNEGFAGTINGVGATSGALVTALALAASTGLGVSNATATGLGLARPMASTNAAGTSNATATTLTTIKSLASSTAVGTSATSGALIEALALASSAAVGASATSGALSEAKLLAGGSQGQAATTALLARAVPLASSTGVGSSATTGFLGKGVPLASTTAVGLGATTADLSSGPGVPFDMGAASSSGFSSAVANLSGGKIKLAVLKDAFTAGISTDPTLGWFRQGGTVWDSVGQRAAFPHGVGASTGNWLIANGTFDITNSSCFAKAVVPTGTDDRYFAFSLYKQYTPNNRISLNVDNFIHPPVLTCEYRVAGGATVPILSTPYDPVAHAWMRYRHTGTNLVMETSPDATTWTTQVSVPVTSLFDLTQVWPEFYFEAFDATPAVTAYVDDISTRGVDLVGVANGTGGASAVLQRPVHLEAATAGLANVSGSLRGTHVALVATATASGVGSTSGRLSVGTEKTETLIDEFSGILIDTSTWATTGLVDTSPMGWHAGSSRLQMLSTGSALTSVNQYTLHESSVSAQIYPQQIDVNHSMTWGVAGASGSYIVWKTVGATLMPEMRSTAGVVWTGASIPYDRILAMWLRIRESAGIVSFEYSKDGVAWLLLAAQPVAAPLSPVNVKMTVASTLPAENSFPRVVLFDNVNIVPVAPPQVGTLVDFFTTAIDPAKWNTAATVWEAGRAKMTGTAELQSVGLYTLIDSGVVAEFNSQTAASVAAFRLIGQPGPSAGSGHNNEIGFQIGSLVSGKRTVLAYSTVNGNTVNGASVALGTGDGSIPTNVTLGQAFGGFSMPLEQVQGAVSDSALDSQAGFIQGIGAGWCRGDYPASLTEPTRGNYNFTSADRWVIAAINHGLKPVPVLYQLPSWMNGSGNDKVPPINNADYGDWCAAAAAHLWTLGVRHVELWNEQNLNTFWAGQPTTTAAYAGKYVAMIKDAYPKIKALVPGMTVLTGGISTADTVHGGAAFGALNTLQDYANLDLYKFCDGVAWHPYLDTDRPCEDLGGPWPGQNLVSYQAALNIIDASNPGKVLKIWSTETGFPRSAGTQALQSSVGHDLWQMVMAGGCCVSIKDRMGPMFWFTVHDRTTGDSREDGFGFYNSNFTGQYAIKATVTTDFAAIYSTTGGGGSPADPAIDIWLRMREVNGVVVWEYAIDPNNFTTLWTAPASVAPQLTPLTVQVDTV